MRALPNMVAVGGKLLQKNRMEAASVGAELRAEQPIDALELMQGSKPW